MPRYIITPPLTESILTKNLLNSEIWYAFYIEMQEALNAGIDSGIEQVFNAESAGGQVQNAILNRVETFTSTGTINVNSNVVYANGTFDLFLPELAVGVKRVYEIKNIGTGVITLKANVVESSVEIEEEVSQPLYAGDCFTVTSDNTDWWVI